MHWLTDAFQYEFQRRVFVGGVLIGFTNGFLGAFIVLRRMALMADSLSHSLLPGLAVALLLFGLSQTGMFFGALVAALIVAVGAQFMARNSRLKEDTALGILYTVAFSSGVVMISYGKFRISLVHYLFGSILGLSNADLWTIYGISLGIVPALIGLQRPLLLTLFDPTVAKSQGIRVNWINFFLMVALVVTMIASLKAIGVIMLLGLLIIPAATVYLLCDSYPAMLWGGGALGAFGCCAGLLISARWDNLPSGACIVLVLGVIFFLAYLFSPRYGLIRRLKPARHFHAESLARWSGEKSAEKKKA